MTQHYQSGCLAKKLEQISDNNAFKRPTNKKVNNIKTIGCIPILYGSKYPLKKVANNMFVTLGKVTPLD